MYFRDGTIYLTRTEVALESSDLYGSRCIPLILPLEEALTIDTPDDWAEAERRLERGA